MSPFDFEKFPIIALDYYSGMHNSKEFVRDTLAMNQMYEGYGSGYPGN